jgi:murein DD-endopeptidase MepM/ murein hydrolase activator NlpD
MLASTPSVWPARGWVSSGFGKRTSPFTGLSERHAGIDIANRTGTAVLASADGIVVYSSRNGSLGKTIKVKHGYGLKTNYGHLSKILVKKGERVKRGQKIGEMGSTGRSTGPHLHYDVTHNGVHVNPFNYILN